MYGPEGPFVTAPVAVILPFDRLQEGAFCGVDHILLKVVATQAKAMLLSNGKFTAPGGLLP